MFLWYIRKQACLEFTNLFSYPLWYSIVNHNILYFLPIIYSIFFYLWHQFLFAMFHMHFLEKPWRRMTQKASKGQINSMCSRNILIIFWEYLKRIKKNYLRTVKYDKISISRNAHLSSISLGSWLPAAISIQRNRNSLN